MRGPKAMVQRVLPVAAATALAAASLALAAETTRSEYKQAVEPICMQNAEANQDILAGVRTKVQQGKLKSAGRQFIRAATALRSTLAKLRQVPQPVADAETLGEWLAGVGREADRLEATGQALTAGKRHRAETLVRQLTEGARETNALVAGFGFHHCRLETTVAG
jgi:hypothetical protein